MGKLLRNKEGSVALVVRVKGVLFLFYLGINASVFKKICIFVAIMAEKRNDYLVSKALKTFMFASVLTALAQQVATTTDAIVVSHLIGPDAISAVNLVTPVLSLCTCIGFLFGTGGSVVAAKAMGRHDMVTANRVFTATMAVMLGTILNFVLDIVFIKVFDMGIAGSAWATIASYLIALAICQLHFRGPHHSFHIDWSFLKGEWSVFGIQGTIVKEGFPMCINSLLLGMCIYGFNSIVLHALGANGMYI